MTWLTRLFRTEERADQDDEEVTRAQIELLASERSVRNSRIEGEEGRALAERLREIRMRNHLAAGLRLRIQEGLRD